MRTTRPFRPTRRTGVLVCIVLALVVCAATVSAAVLPDRPGAPAPSGSSASTADPRPADPARGPAREPSKSPETPDGTSPVRVMLVGDSVTQGARGDATWRYLLWERLQALGVDFDLVGPYRGVRYQAPDGSITHYDGGYRFPDFDTDHASKWGLEVADIPGIDGWMRTFRPDVVVLALGVNDLLTGTTPEQTAGLVEQRIATMRAVDPDVDVVLAAPTQTWVAGVPAYARLLADLALRLDTATSRVDLAPAPPGYTQGVHTYDLLHPNPVGEELIMRSVLDGLLASGAVTPTAVADPASDVSGCWRERCP